jgi:hypothetical protein
VEVVPMDAANDALHRLREGTLRAQAAVLQI